MVDTKDLLKDFIGDRVMIVTKMIMSTLDDMGDPVEVPKVFYGELLGVDDKFLYIGDQDIPLIILNIDEMSMIERDPGSDFDTPNELIMSGSDDTIN